MLEKRLLQRVSTAVSRTENNDRRIGESLKGWCIRSDAFASFKIQKLTVSSSADRFMQEYRHILSSTGPFAYGLVTAQECPHSTLAELLQLCKYVVFFCIHNSYSNQKTNVQLERTSECECHPAQEIAAYIFASTSWNICLALILLSTSVSSTI